MRFLLYISLVIIIASCQDVKPVEVNDFGDEKLVLEGVISDSIETQTLRVGLANNISDSAFVPISDISLNMSTGGLSVPFNLVNGTHLVSAIPFAGIPDSVYDVDFCYKNECYNGSFTMPGSFQIESFQVDEDQVIGGQFIDAMNATLTSATDQFLRYDVYVQNISSSNDTTWDYRNGPIYWTQTLPAGTSNIILNQFHPNQYNFYVDHAVKIVVHSIHSQTAEYFDQLQSFMDVNFAGSQYQNPPLYYNGEVYGMVYGTCVDSAIYIF